MMLTILSNQVILARLLVLFHDETMILFKLPLFSRNVAIVVKWL